MNRIFIYGPPASGKTTVSRELGSALGCPVLDTDEQIVLRAGRPIPEIFASDGEGFFRELEASVLKECIERTSGSECIISLGGGTLLRAESRALCESEGTVICLDTPPEAELCRRLGLAPGSRPLGDRSRERAPHYASFPNRLAASFILPDSLVLVGTGIARALMKPEKTVFDGNVAALYPELASSPLGVIPSGEVNKTPDTVMKLWHAFAAAGIGRRDTVMACGGGVTGDLTGFAAATWMRGTNWRNFPTTLLSMVDASTGGKTGCDLPEGKNLAGAFHSPRIVVIDTLFLNTLPEKELAVGKAEMIKHEIIGGCSNVVSKGTPTAGQIADNLSVKVGIVREDPLETKGRRLLLNCGHTVGHAIELALDYRLSHGEAVAIGCVQEAKHAVKLGLAHEKWPAELAERFAEAGLPVELPAGHSFESLVPLMRGDKKRQGNSVTFALPCGWGDVRAVKIELA